MKKLLFILTISAAAFVQGHTVYGMNPEGNSPPRIPPPCRQPSAPEKEPRKNPLHRPHPYDTRFQERKFPSRQKLFQNP